MTTEAARRIPPPTKQLPSAIETVAEAYLAALRSRGIERLYLNAGTDFAPIAEAYGRLQTGASAPFPEPVLAAHENLAMRGAERAVSSHCGSCRLPRRCSITLKQVMTPKRYPAKARNQSSSFFDGGASALSA